MKNNILKSIFVTILLLLGVSHAAWGRTIYLDTSGASSPYDGTNWWAHIWDGDGTGNKALTKVKDNLYEVEVGTCSTIIFVPNNSTGSDWNNQTKNIAIPSDKNCYQITGKNTGSWVNYQKFSIEGITKSETESNYTIHMWGNGVTATDFKFYETNNDNYYLVTNKSGWDMSSWTGFGFRNGDSWIGGGGVTISATNTWAEKVYGGDNGTLPSSGMAYAIYFYYDGSSTSALYLSTTPYPTIEWTTAPAGGTVGGNMTATVSTNQSEPTITWTSSNTSVATVDNNGKITYKAAGTTTITASYTGDGTTYCAEKVSVDKEITVTEATALNIYVQGRFKVRTAKDGSNWLYTGNADDNSWNTDSKNIKFEYEEATGYYKLNTYCSVGELSAPVSGTNYYFHFKEGSTEYGATDDNVRPALEAEKRTILSGIKNFLFTDACPEGDNVVLYLDWGNKKFWYAVDASSTYTVTFDMQGHGEAIAAKKVTSGETATEPTPAPTAAGFIFGGWYTDSECNNKYDFSTAVTGTLTLYAKWTEDYSTKTFYYFDDKKTTWDGEVGIAMNNTKEYAFILRPAYNNTDNKFKIFDCNPKDDNTCLIANGDNIATEPLCKEITLTKEPPSGNDDWKNILMPATTSDYFVILYYPNTTINPSNNFLVAASYTLPNAKTYNVSFGVVDNTGGTLIAKSGSSTIESGALVSFATFTATPAAGYAVEGWYADAEGKTKIDAADTNTTYSQLITAADNSVYVKFAKVYAIYYKFNDQKWDDNYYAYIFTDEVWHSDNGVQPNVNRSEHGKMSKYNDSVYYYKFTKSADYTRFAFSWGDHSTDDYFNNIDAVYRSDFHKDMPVFIAERGQSASVTKGKYYNKGVWMKFNDTDPGYNLCLYTNSTWDVSTYRFTADNAGDYVSTVNVVLNAGQEYSFWVKNDKNYYFKTSKATCTAENYRFTFYTYDMGGDSITITPTITGTYTFQLNLANGKVEIDVLYPTTSYRLVYVEKDGSTIKKFHPSHIIKSHPEATAEAPMFDTVSMHVRPKVLGGNSGKDTLDNTYNCAIVLQTYELSSQTWQDGQTIDVKHGSFSNGVYNFVVKQDGSSVTIDDTKTHPYTGRYYIRTDASDGGWVNFKQFSNLCYYTDYSRVYRGFDYYYCHWVSKTNIKYTIACDYSYCVSDTLAQEDHDPHSTYTDANGTLQHNANVRFMWNSFSNELDRAYIAGADDNLYLMSEARIYDMKGNQNTSAKLEDQENWVYRADVKADTQARIRLRAVPYNGATTYSWFRGKEGEITNKNNTEQLIEGKADTRYTIRVIYDFKTDHLICAWVPDGNVIPDTIVVNADLMLLRENHGDAAQLKFSTNGGQLKDITVAYSVINITKAHLSDKDKTLREKEIYWISFPYDVNLSDVFGCGKYGEHFIIQYYDGAARAEKGCWADSPTFWTYIENPTGVVLKKGLGYVLVLDSEKILEDQFKYNNASVNIYFPSSGPIDSIDAKLPTAVEVPEHKCTIKRDDRYIYDSNWNIIGVPTWANIDKFYNPMMPEQSGETKVGFYYAHNASNNEWSVCNAQNINFQSMYSYLVQWAGTINWQEKSATGEHHPSSLAPRRYAPAAEGEGEATAPEQYTLCLTLNRGGQQLDQTYVRLQEGNVTTDFDLNYDMTKILNSGANLYSLVGTNLIQCAANVQPLQEEAQTISIPLGVVADQDGLYTFSLPEGTEGMNVSIADSESGTVHNLALGDYQTALSKGTYEGRFALEIRPRQEVTTGCEQTDAAGKHLRKVLIDGNLYILRDGKAYTAAGQEL